MRVHPKSKAAIDWSNYLFVSLTVIGGVSPFPLLFCYSFRIFFVFWPFPSFSDFIFTFSNSPQTKSNTISK